MNRELEDIFREGLGDKQSNPSPQTWKRIKNRLWWQDVIHLLNNAAVEPSSKLWPAISAQLWWHGFLRFNVSRFNVYYLVTAVMVTAGAFLYAPSASESKGLALSSGSVAPEFVIQNKSVTPETPEKQSPVSGNSFINAGETNITDIKVGEEHIYAEQTKEEAGITVSEMFSPGLMPSLWSGIESQQPEGLLSGRDSIVNWKGEPVCFDNFRWSADLFFAQSAIRMRTPASDTEDLYANDLTASVFNMYSAGAGVNFQSGRFSLHSGLAYTSTGFTSEYNSMRYKTDTVVISWVTDGGFFEYDTLWVLNLDSLINGNPTYVAVLDSHFIHTSDTISVNKPVTTKEITAETAVTRISYFEIPLLAGYSLSSGKLSYRLKAGVVPGILFYSRGTMANPYSKYGDMTAGREILNQWTVSGYTSLEIHYQPFARLGFSAEPFYRHSFTSLFNKDFPYQTRLDSWGCRFMVRYYIR